MSIEKYLIEHCASTLASLKTANLFNIEYDSHLELLEHLTHWNTILNEKGVFVTALKITEKKALIYVYRKSRLLQELERKDIRKFLCLMGYTSFQLKDVLNTLRIHLSKEDFPHEIGIFLGYPLEDVIGFIENKGKNPKCSGCWKVYCNPQEAEKMFCKIKKCTAVYTDLWKQGRSVCQLTVAR